MADELTLGIDRIGHLGDGIAIHEGEDLYVPFALPGETARVALRAGKAELLEIERPSGDRTGPPCRHFGQCGGCALQHYASPAYLEWKRELVVTAFAQRGIGAAVGPTIAIPTHSRRRLVLAAVNTKAGAIVGFNRRASNEVIAIEECPVAVPAIVDRLDLLRRVAALSLPRGGRGRIVVIAADNGLDIAVEGGKAPGRNQARLLAELAADPALARLTIDGESVLQSRRPEIAVGKTVLLPVPGGFLQASATAEAAIIAAVRSGIDTAGPVADLFAGLGTISLRLAEASPVTAVDGDAELLAALGESKRAASGLKPVQTLQRDLFRTPLSARELDRFSAVVFDPPRAGAKAQAEAIAASGLKQVVAVSCNPATLARDARILLDGGFALGTITPIDQFLWSPHVEAVAVFRR